MANERGNVSLRQATPDDEPFLFEVYASTRDEELAGLDWDDSQKLAFIRMQFLVRERSYPRGDDRIILLNERAIGRMLVNRTNSAILLTDIAVLTQYRNTGIGTRLIQDLMKEAAESAKPVHLHVLETSPAVRLYERLGFSRLGTDAAYLEMKWDPTGTIENPS
ncbi:MAG TPA: GNAT family N-acetyltransferase [Pyrinomonadaceae bacterium]